MTTQNLPLATTAQAGTPQPAVTDPEDAPSSPQLGAEGPAFPRPALPLHERPYVATVRWEFAAEGDAGRILEQIEAFLDGLPGRAQLVALDSAGTPVTPQSPMAQRREAGRLRYLPRRD